MMLNPNQIAILNLLICGTLSETADQVGQSDSDEAIKLLASSAETEPKFLLEAISSSCATAKPNSMIVIALAYLTAKAPDGFLSKRSNQVHIMNLLGAHDPTQLLEYVDILRSKELGRGFGARSQKWVKDVLQGWNIDTLKVFIQKYRAEVCALVRAVHPAFVGARGDEIRKALQEEKYGLVC